MKPWKVWIGVVTVVACLSLIAVVLALWNNLATEWSVERNAAQFALNHSPIDSITAHSIFNGNQTQEVFEGTDALNQKWYVFVYGSPFAVKAVPASGLIPAQRAKQLIHSLDLTNVQATVGYITATNTAIRPQSPNVVWELMGLTGAGSVSYVYIDATTGKILWKYVL